MKNRIPDWAIDLIPPVLFALLLSIHGPWWSIYEFDRDEGVNLMKAALVADGYFLYSEIWSDQPPVLTFLLALLVKAFGNSIAAPRLLILLFSCALLGALFRLIRRLEGMPVAVLAVACLGLDYLYARLSVSVMIGLPAISLAVLSLTLLLSDSQRPGLARLGASALLMALSLQIKLFTVTLLPMLILALFLAPGEKPGRDLTWRSEPFPLAAKWVLILLASFIAVAFLSDLNPVRDTLDPHLKAAGKSLIDFEEVQKIFKSLQKDVYFLYLVPAGLFFAGFLRRKTVWIPLSWFLASFLALIVHNPIWYHHGMLLIPPLCWICGLSARAFPRLFPGGENFFSDGRLPTLKQSKAVQFLLFVTLIIIIAGQTRVYALFHKPKERDLAVAELVRKYKPRTRWMVTDRPIDAFYNDIAIPPPLAVYSKKRLNSGLLSGAAIIKYMERYRPEQVSFRRLRIPDAVRGYLSEKYVVIGQIPRHHFFVLPHLAEKNSAEKPSAMPEN